MTAQCMQLFFFFFFYLNNAQTQRVSVLRREKIKGQVH